TNHIGCPESSRFWPSQDRSGKPVDLFHIQIKFPNQMRNRQHRVNTYTVSYKGRRIFTQHGRLTQKTVTIMHQKIKHLGVCTRPRDNFEQSKIARRIKKVRTAEVPAKIV